MVTKLIMLGLSNKKCFKNSFIFVDANTISFRGELSQSIV